MGKASKEGCKAVVEVIANGTNEVSLVFPKGAKFRLRRKLSAEDVAKVLRGGKKEGDVVGQIEPCSFLKHCEDCVPEILGGP